MVAGYKRCPQGHFYKDDLAQCPYCLSKPGAGNPTDIPTGEYVNSFPGGGATVPGGGSGPTIPGGGGGDSNKTQVIPDWGGTVPNSGAFTSEETINIGPSPKPSTPTKTMIFDEETDDGKGKGEIRSSRRLVGWLVSYTLDEMGVDFKLFEGRNIIGRDLDCQISVNDSTVSAKHAVLLYRAQKYSITDQQSTHGTFVNGEDIELRPIYLNDGDIIKVGKTVFKFRTSF